MGVKIQGMLDVQGMLMRMDTTTKKRVVLKLIQKGKELKELAIRMAPVDEGNLEHAIKMTPEEGGHGSTRLRSDGSDGKRKGTFLRTEVEVYVDMDMRLPNRPKNTVGDYAYEIHEHLSPMGHKNLGEKSILKQLASPGVLVGGGFMTRAADQIELGLDAALREALDGLI